MIRQSRPATLPGAAQPHIQGGSPACRTHRLPRRPTAALRLPRRPAGFYLGARGRLYRVHHRGHRLAVAALGPPEAGHPRQDRGHDRHDQLRGGSQMQNPPPPPGNLPPPPPPPGGYSPPPPPSGGYTPPPPPMGGGYPMQQPATGFGYAPQVRYGGFWIRLLALIIAGLIVGIPAALVAGIVTAVVTASSNNNS